MPSELAEIKKSETAIESSLSRFEKQNYETSELIQQIVHSVQKLSPVPNDKDDSNKKDTPVINGHLDKLNALLSVQSVNITTLTWIKNRLQEII